MMDTGFDFARNIREIERLKAGLLSATAEIYELMCDGEHGDAVFEAVAAMISTSYCLAERTGINKTELDKRVQERLAGG